MTSAEFNTWLDDLEMRFPSVTNWLHKVAEDVQQRLKVLRSWQIVLGDVTLANCLAINLSMQAGDLPWVGEYDGDKERLPQHVRRLAKQLAYSERPTQSEPDRDYRPSDFPAGKMLRRLQELVASGTPHDESMKQVAAEIPAGSPQREARYNCHLCQDSRRIFVASPSAVRSMLDERFDKCHHRIGVVRCRCDSRQSDRFPLEQFNPQLDFRIEDYAWGPSEVERFRVWVDWQREHSVEQRAKSCANYDQGFADFNNR